MSLLEGHFRSKLQDQESPQAPSNLPEMWVFLSLQNSAVPLGVKVIIMPLIFDGPHPTEKNGHWLRALGQQLNTQLEGNIILCPHVFSPQLL